MITHILPSFAHTLFLHPFGGLALQILKHYQVDILPHWETKSRAAARARFCRLVYIPVTLWFASCGIVPSHAPDLYNRRCQNYHTCHRRPLILPFLLPDAVDCRFNGVPEK